MNCISYTAVSLYLPTQNSSMQNSSFGLNTSASLSISYISTSNDSPESDWQSEMRSNGDDEDWVDVEGGHGHPDKYILFLPSKTWSDAESVVGPDPTRRSVISVEVSSPWHVAAADSWTICSLSLLGQSSKNCRRSVSKIEGQSWSYMSPVVDNEGEAIKLLSADIERGVPAMADGERGASVCWSRPSNRSSDAW